MTPQENPAPPPRDPAAAPPKKPPRGRGYAMFSLFVGLGAFLIATDEMLWGRPDRSGLVRAWIVAGVLFVGVLWFIDGLLTWRKSRAAQRRVPRG